MNLVRRKSADKRLVEGDARMISLDVSNLRCDAGCGPFPKGEMDFHAFGATASLPQCREKVAELVSERRREWGREGVL